MAAKADKKEKVGKPVVPAPAEPCTRVCSKIVPLLDGVTVPASNGLSSGEYTNVDGYRYLNVFVEFSQERADEPPVNLGVTFAFDEHGTLASRRFVNLEENPQTPQHPGFVEVSGQGTWHGTPWDVSRYMLRVPVMGPYVQVFVYNHAGVDRTVTVRGYATA